MGMGGPSIGNSLEFLWDSFWCEWSQGAGRERFGATPPWVSKHIVDTLKPTANAVTHLKIDGWKTSFWEGLLAGASFRECIRVHQGSVHATQFADICRDCKSPRGLDNKFVENLFEHVLKIRDSHKKCHPFSVNQTCYPLEV